MVEVKDLQAYISFQKAYVDTIKDNSNYSSAYLSRVKTQVAGAFALYQYSNHDSWVNFHSADTIYNEWVEFIDPIIQKKKNEEKEKGILL